MTRIVAYGDAIAAGLAKTNPHLINLGLAGRGLVANNLPATIGIERGDALIVSIGWSDVGALFSPQPTLPLAAYERRLVARLLELHARSGGSSAMTLLGMEPLTKPYPGINNAHLLPMNQILEKAARHTGIAFLDLAAKPIGYRAMDGLLYQPAGYRMLLARCGHLEDVLGLGLHQSTPHLLGGFDTSSDALS